MVSRREFLTALAGGWWLVQQQGPPSMPVPQGIVVASTHPPNTGEVAFVWDAFGTGTTSYVLIVGTSPGGSDMYNQNVGNVLTQSVSLPGGRYYANVQAQPSGTWKGEQQVEV